MLFRGTGDEMTRFIWQIIKDKVRILHSATISMLYSSYVGFMHLRVPLPIIFQVLLVIPASRSKS
jgi:hypothetical protein